MALEIACVTKQPDPLSIVTFAAQLSVLLLPESASVPAVAHFADHCCGAEIAHMIWMWRLTLLLGVSVLQRLIEGTAHTFRVMHRAHVAAMSAIHMCATSLVLAGVRQCIAMVERSWLNMPVTGRQQLQACPPNAMLLVGG